MRLARGQCSRGRGKRRGSFNALGAGDEAREQPLKCCPVLPVHRFNALGAGDEARELGRAGALRRWTDLVSMPSVRAMRLASWLAMWQAVSARTEWFQCPRCGR